MPIKLIRFKNLIKLDTQIKFLSSLYCFFRKVALIATHCRFNFNLICVLRINSRALFAGFITITMLSGCGKTDTAGNSVIPLPTYKIIKLDTLKKDSTAKMSSKIIDWMGANTSMLSTRYSSGFISGKSDIGNYTGSGDIYRSESVV